MEKVDVDGRIKKEEDGERARRGRVYITICVSFVYRHGLKRLHWVRRGRRQLKEMMETQQQRARKGKERKNNTKN